MTNYIVTIRGSQVSEDGESARINAETESDEEITLTFPSSELESTIIFLAQAAGHAGRIRQNLHPQQKRIQLFEWWNIEPVPDSGVLMSFRISGGAEISFHLDRQVALRFHETLSVLLGVSIPQKPETAPN